MQILQPGTEVQYRKVGRAVVVQHEPTSADGPTQRYTVTFRTGRYRHEPVTHGIWLDAERDVIRRSMAQKGA
jgi:hypothetical protein